MFVCLCFGVSEKRLKEIVAQGGTTLEKLQARCGAGSSCGSCIDDIKRTLSNCEQSTEQPINSDDESSYSHNLP